MLSFRPRRCTPIAASIDRESYRIPVKELINKETRRLFRNGSVNIQTSKTLPVLPELSADNAKGEIKHIYQSIEAALGVRLVNLVYRHLATVPGALEWAWYTVGEPFQAGIFAERSKALIPSAPGPQKHGISMDAAGLTAEDAENVIKTLDAYNRANPMNAVSLRVIALALEAARPASAAPVDAPPPVDLPTLLPMVSLDSLDPAETALMHRLARLTTGRESKIVPSLFRHFASWPGLLRQIADWMDDLNDSGVIDDQAARVFEMADDIAKDIFAALPAPGREAVLPDPATRQTLVETIEMFPPTICRMIVIAGLLRSRLSADIRSG
jgi:hypothetical protein